MCERSVELAEQLEASTSALISAIEGGDEGEARVLAHHLATCHALVFSLAQAVVNREPLPSISWAMMHEINLQHVRANTTVGADGALALLRKTTASTAEAIRQLSDEQLDATTSWAPGARVSAHSLIERHIIGHAEEHLTQLTTPRGP